MSLPGIICAESPRKCELCGKLAETRPYGPDGKRICFECGNLPELKEEVERRMEEYLFGPRIPRNN